MHPPIITLTTDFGTAGPYVAAMKGVILAINRNALIVDVSHEIRPQGIREAALCLAAAAPYFPGGSIHVVVVDPGVGSSRRLLCALMHDQVFLAPDNGVLSWAARGTSTIERIELAEPRFWRGHVSATFHGRDVLAPVAAHLSLGVNPRELGRAVADWIELPWPAPTPRDGGIDGEVLAIDRFGNLITNVAESDLPRQKFQLVRVRCAGQEIGSPVRTYADVEPGNLLALVGSNSLLEIAVRDGSAAERLGVRVGSPVQVGWRT